MTNNNWIFLRGLTRGNAHWGNFPEIFKSLNPESEAEFLEIPGNGTLNKVDTLVDAKKIIYFLKRKSKFYSQEEMPVHLCGISLGGMVALKWAELFPQNIQSVSVINTSLQQCSPFYQRLLPQNYFKIISMLFESSAHDKELNILTITSNKPIENQNYLEAFAAFSTAFPVSKMNSIRQLILARKIKINKFPPLPLKIISSKMDRLVSPLCSDGIAKTLGGAQYIHPTAGHDLPLDEPSWLSEVLISKK